MAEIAYNEDVMSIVRTLNEGFNALLVEFRQLSDSLLNKEREVNSNESPVEWLTLEQLVDYIPGRPAIPSLRRWIKTEGLPAQKIKRKLVFQKSQVDQWLKNRTVVPNAEIERQVKESMLVLEKNKKPRWRQKKSAS